MVLCFLLTLVLCFLLTLSLRLLNERCVMNREFVVIDD